MKGHERSILYNTETLTERKCLGKYIKYRVLYSGR